MNEEAAVVVDEAQLTEFIQEEADTGAGCAHHGGHSLLADPGSH